MPIKVEHLQDNIIVFRMIGNIPSADIVSTIQTELISRIKDEPVTLHAIYDVTEFAWDFPQFIEYIKSKKSSAPDDDLTGTLYEHFVGQNTWVTNLRTWWMKNFNKETSAFTSIDYAVDYINELTAKHDSASA